MKLIIDIGNTRIKAALFEQKKLISAFYFVSIAEIIDANLFSKNSISHCIIANVTSSAKDLFANLNANCPIITFDTNLPVPLTIKYKTPATLGADRLACAVGASVLFNQQNVLIIDAGTCIKYDFVNADNEYIGGGISPGLEMRFKALQHFTARLPLLKIDNEFNQLIGSNTTESILSGVQMGAMAEVQGIIEGYQLKFPNLRIVFTGGDASFFEKQFKKPIFADQNLVLKGLNEILDFNIY
jgi:type III pantothenate kinase